MSDHVVFIWKINQRNKCFSFHLIETVAVGELKCGFYFVKMFPWCCRSHTAARLSLSRSLSSSFLGCCLPLLVHVGNCAVAGGPQQADSTSAPVQHTLRRSRCLKCQSKATEITRRIKVQACFTLETTATC